MITLEDKKNCAARMVPEPSKTDLMVFFSTPYEKITHSMILGTIAHLFRDGSADDGFVGAAISAPQVEQ